VSGVTASATTVGNGTATVVAALVIRVRTGPSLTE
jgi:hypothetical protein